MSNDTIRVLASPAFKSREVNPHTWLLYTHVKKHNVEVTEFKKRRVLTASPNTIWHTHWPEGLLKYRSTFKVAHKLAIFMFLLGWARLRNIKVIWTVHNLGPHERIHGWLEALFWRAFLKSVDGFINMNQTGRALTLEKFPALRKKKGFVIYRGHYRDVYPADVNRSQAREALDLPQQARVALFIGQIRDYKNVPQLIRVFKKLSDADARLVIAGNPRSEALRTEILHEAADDARVITHLKFISTDDIQKYMMSADFIVVPYEDILNSGAAFLALSFDRPLLMPKKGALVELQNTVGEEWIRLYEGNRLSTDILNDAFNWSVRAESARPNLDLYSWDNTARATVEAYRSVLSGS